MIVMNLVTTTLSESHLLLDGLQGSLPVVVDLLSLDGSLVQNMFSRKLHLIQSFQLCINLKQ